jgi:NAD-dependent deacetylase
LIRPGVVWFGEGIERMIMSRSAAALDCDIFFTIGTSSVVYPAAVVQEAKQRGAFTVEMNTESTPVSASLDMALHGFAGVLLDRVERHLRT